MRLIIFSILPIIGAFALVDDRVHFKNPGEDLCVPLTECKEVANKFKTFYRTLESAHIEYADKVKNLTCRYEGNEAYICCPPNKLVEQEVSGYPFKCVSPKKKDESSESDTISIHLGTSSDADYDGPRPHQGPEEKKPNSQVVTKIIHDYSKCGQVPKLSELLNFFKSSDFPWSALLEYNTKSGKTISCGGVLISDQYVLTSADCATYRLVDTITVHLGDYIITRPSRLSVKIDTEKIIVHDGYDMLGRDMDDRFKHNIALLKLKTKVKFNKYVQPICLPNQEPTNKKYYIAGWSNSFINTNMLKVKKMSQVTVIDNCPEEYSFEYPALPDKYICVGGRKSILEKACVADAGGPLMSYEKQNNGEGRMILAGISVTPMNCDHKSRYPGIYAPIYEYIPWIHEQMKN